MPFFTGKPHTLQLKAQHQSISISFAMMYSFILIHLILPSGCQAVDETKPKKMVRRSIAIAFGIICIILIASLGGIVAYYYTSIIPDLNQKDSTISSMNSQISDLNDRFYKFSRLEDSIIWIANQTTTTQDTEIFNEFFVNYCGYVMVNVTSTSSNTTVRVAWTNYEYNFVDQQLVGKNGTAVFPLLASPDQWMNIGLIVNFGTPANRTNTATITAIFYQ